MSDTWDPVRERAARSDSLDAFRGFAVLGMIVVNAMAPFRAAPQFLKHARPGEAMTFADLVAPLFLFALGLLYVNSLKRRTSRQGRRDASVHFLRRYGLLLLIGMIGGAAGKMRLTFDWGILQAIGLAGILVLPVAAFPPQARATAAALLLVVFGWLPASLREVVTTSEHGGPLGALAWTALVLIATCAGESLTPKPPARRLAVAMTTVGTFLAAAGALLALAIPISKPALSPSYVLFSCGLSALVFALFIVAYDLLRARVPVLPAFGRNALVLFLLHYPLVRALRIFLARDAPWTAVTCGVAAIAALCAITAWQMDRRGWYVVL